ncbi:MAG: NAD(+) synthase, partial [Bacteroidales bacterium]|nr:NAD(+) synthase [Bacteroidales bacterium]
FFMAQECFCDNYDKDTILHWLKTFVRRFFTQQFKRACLPEGAQAGLISLSPRGAWSMPSDAIYRAWMEALENL